VITRNVYEAFVNPNDAYKSIKLNFKSLIENKQFNYQNFIIDWKQSILSVNGQPHDEFDVYRESLKKLLDKIAKDLLTDNEQKEKIFRELFTQIAECHLRCDSLISNKRGVKFVIDAYRGRFGHVNEGNKYGHINKFRTTNLFSDDVWNEWWNTLCRVDCEFIEKNCDFVEFFSLIFNNDFLENNGHNTDFELEVEVHKNTSLNHVYLISSRLGELLNKQLKENTNVNISFWKSLILPFLFDKDNTANNNSIQQKILKFYETDISPTKQNILKFIETKLETKKTESDKSKEARINAKNIIESIKYLPEYLSFFSFVNFYVFKGYLLSGNTNLIELVFFQKLIFFLRFLLIFVNVMIMMISKKMIILNLNIC
jgi:hypothetical protein